MYNRIICYFFISLYPKNLPAFRNKKEMLEWKIIDGTKYLEHIRFLTPLLYYTDTGFSNTYIASEINLKNKCSSILGISVFYYVLTCKESISFVSLHIGIGLIKYL